MVVFISGECGDSCFYCPVSEGRFGKDRAYANEFPVKDLMDYVYESYRMKAVGAGITGGDPLLHLDRVVELIGILKSEFGRSYHVHLYTTGRYATSDALRELERSGLDEIRFHPVKESYLEAVERALRTSMDVGLEVPAIPGKEEWLRGLVQWAKNKGVKFVNINELEITERNAGNLAPLGFNISHGLAGAKGSFETSLRVLQEFSEAEISLHYCSSVYKDVVETRTRFLRTVRTSAKPYEEYTGEGTVVRALVRTKEDLLDYGEKREEVYSVSPSIVEELMKKGLADEVWLVEELPYGQKVSETLVFRRGK